MKRQSGVLMHISSLWGDYGCGSFGKAAYEFVDFLSECGFGWWQTLPFTVVDECNSPYKSVSAFGGNPYFIDLDELFKDGLLTKAELDSARQKTPYSCEYERLSKERVSLLMKAASRADSQLKKKVKALFDSNRHIAGFCVFMAKKQANGFKEWTEWTTEEYDPRICEGWAFIQYIFSEQWKKLKAYANQKGIRFIGDVPIYVSFDSADVYNNKQLFLMKGDRLTDVAGVPPDYFSADGQLWGNPLYDWAAMEKDGFSWWKERLEYQLSFFDGLRIDHFRGIESFWAVPSDAKTAKEGKWLKGPGKKLTDAIKAVSADKLIIAEDLGDITEDVVKLVKDSGFPGMRVFQFGFLDDSDTPHRPHNYENNCVAYSGTHDNNTLLGYLWEMPSDTKKKVMEYCVTAPDRWGDLGCDGIIRTIYASSAGLTVFPIQDLLGYGNDTRLNVPGRAEGNWLYRVTREQVFSLSSAKYRALGALYNR